MFIPFNGSGTKACLFIEIQLFDSLSTDIFDVNRNLDRQRGSDSLGYPLVF
jgi:hypothetical protein